MLFAGGNRVLFPTGSRSAEPAQIQNAMAMLGAEQGGGATELRPALRTALSFPQIEGTSRTIVVVTDGYVRCESGAFDLVRENLNRANLFAFGIGSAVNRHIIDGLAHAGMGEPFVVLNQEEASPIAERFRKYISSPVLTGIQYSFENFDAYDVQPQVLPDLFADRPLILFGKWKGSKKGTITISGTAGGDMPFTQTVEIAKAETSTSAAIRYLWARYRIAVLSDYAGVAGNSENKKLITQLGLKYNLLTQNTSFVAVDQVLRNTAGTSLQVKQPLPLPHGVPNFAVGTAPEPETWCLLGVTMLLLGVTLLKPQRAFTRRVV